jgi:hypothetical protein
MGPPGRRADLARDSVPGLVAADQAACVSLSAWPLARPSDKTNPRPRHGPPAAVRPEVHPTLPDIVTRIGRFSSDSIAYSKEAGVDLGKCMWSADNSVSCMRLWARALGLWPCAKVWLVEPCGGAGVVSGALADIGADDNFHEGPGRRVRQWQLGPVRGGGQGDPGQGAGRASRAAAEKDCRPR